MRSIIHYNCGETRESWRSLRSWYESPLGERMLAAERLLIDQLLTGLFGYHIVQVGRATSVDLLRASRIGHRMLIDGDTDGLVGQPKVEPCMADHHALPLQGGSVDVVLLHHTLEFTQQPHQVLREAERVLIPEGHVLIAGFNPFGLWGMRRLACGWRGRMPWCGEFFSPSRIKDWLALLGFDTVLARGCFYRPPLRHAGIMQRLEFMERLAPRGPLLGAGGYLLLAKKRVATLTPIKPRWRPRRALLASGLVKGGVRRET
jgi:SAM-dependent methyltransferase